VAEILVDSSVWIAAQDPKSNCFRVLSRLLKSENDEVVTSSLIQLEVSQGACSEKIQDVLWDGFEGLRRFDLSPEIFRKSASNYLRCRKGGITPTTIDCLLGTQAREYGLSFWSLDENIKRMSKIIGFEVYRAVR
jgi:predicted nucleic acid-binding protein